MYASEPVILPALGSAAGAAGGGVVLARQALHAAEFSIFQPTNDHRLTFRAAIPQDMQAALDCLRRG